MPNIKEYDTGQLGLQPTEVGVEARAAAARRSGAFFHEAAQDITTLGQRVSSAVRDAGDAYVKYNDHREISAGAAHGAEMINNLDQSWNSTAKSADPNDPSVAAKWRTETLEPTLAKFREGFTSEGSQRWAEHFVDSYRQHAFIKTSADMSSLAADAVHVNTLKTINNLGSTAYNDPSSLPIAREMLRTSVEGMVQSSPNLNAIQAAKVRNDLMLQGEEHLVRSSVMGAIAKGGDWQSIANDPKNKDYIKPAEIEQFARAAKAQQRADLWYEKQAELMLKQQEADAAHKGLSDLWTNSVRFDERTGKAIIDPKFLNNALDIERAHPGAATERVRAFTRWAQEQQREKREIVVTDPATHARLLDGIFNTESPTTDVDILTAAAEGKVNGHDTSVLLNLNKSLQDLPKDPSFKAKLDDVKEMLGFSIMPDGHHRYASFMDSFWPEFVKQKRAGTLPPNALDMNDKTSLIRKWADQYKPDAKDRLKWHMYKLLGGQREDVLRGGAGPAEGAPPFAGAEPSRPPIPSNVPRATSKEEYDKLPSKTWFLDSKGDKWWKP